MAGSRTLKLSILADVDDLKSKLSAGADEVEGFGSKVADFGKKAAAAFAAAGVAAAAYAGKLLIDGVKSAVEDEKAQATLAQTLKNVTGATQAQIKSIEDYVTKTSLAFGVTDDKLRPAFDRLVRSTSDLSKAQKLLNLAINISASTGIELETVANALAKAQDGNVNVLKKLGIETQKTITVTKDNTAAQNALERAQLAYNQALEKFGFMSPQAEKAQLALQQAMEKANVTTSTSKRVNLEFDEILKNLSETFSGQASIAANTFEGKLTRLKIAFDEGKETVGSFVLNAITPMVNFIVQKVTPAIAEFSNSIGTNLQPTFQAFATFFTETLIPALQQWWSYLSETVIPAIIKTVRPIVEGLSFAFSKIATAIKDNEEGLKPLFNLFKAVAEFIVKTLAPAIGTTLGTALKVIGTLVAGLITGFAKIVELIDGVVKGIERLIELIAANPAVRGIGTLIGNVFGGGRAAGGPVNRNTAYMVGENGPELFVPQSSGRIIPNGSGGSVINITVNGAIDATSTARQIVELLNNEAAVSGSFTNLGLNRFAVRA